MATTPPPSGFVMDQLPEGFVIDEPRSSRRKRNRGGAASPSGTLYDGDTFDLSDGRSARLFGVDAFERDQLGRNLDGSSAPLGEQARSVLADFATPAATASLTGAETYGRPVSVLALSGSDAGRALVESGMALPEPRYLASDPGRLSDYVDTQRAAIAAERGAYAGQYQRPSEYRRQGGSAPMRGKIAMTPAQRREYTSLLRSPDTTEAQLSDWMAAQGHAATNLGNVLDFARRNPKAKPATYFQQQDALDAPVLPDGPNVVARSLGALNEGIADTLGAPVDLVNGGLGLLGLPVSDDPFGGSNSIRSGMHALGIGQDSEAYAPRSAAERYVQSIARGIGQAALPAGGTIAAGARLGVAGAGMVSQEGGAVAQALRRMASEAAARPGLAIAGEVGGGVGAGIGGQAARDEAPGNPYADMVGQVLGGIAGGVGAGFAATARSRGAVPRRSPAAVEVESIGGQPVVPATTSLPDGFVLDGPALSTRPSTPPLAPRQREVLAIPSDGPASPASAPAAPAIGPHGPIHTDLSDDYPSAVARLILDEDGEVPAAITHPATGPIDLVWGDAGTGKSDGYGLAKIAKFHPEVLEDLPSIVAAMDVRKITPGRVQLESADHKAAVRLEYDGERKTWLLTAFRKDDAPASTMDSRADAAGQSFTDRGAAPNISATGTADNVPPPPGFGLDTPVGKARPVGDRASAENMAALARGIEPDDVRPIPANQIESLDEAVRANPGTLRDVQAPDERDALTPYRLRPDGPRRRDPLDLISWLRTRGGIQDQGGNLRAAGIDNKARPIEFAKSEGFLGKLVSDEGMTLDDAAAAAHDAGFFPDLPDRPTINEFLDAVADTHRGGPGRMFHPDDYAAIDEYRAAQDQRYAVERAEQDGAPIAEDVGQPVDMSDLDANQPPATAYEDLPSVGGRAGNIALDKLESGEDIRRALLGTDAKVGGFGAARRGTISHNETAQLARELGMTSNDLLKRRQGQALNAEQALAARSILAKSGQEIVRLANKAGTGGDEALAAFREGWLRHVAIQEQVSGATAEAGRALSQFRVTAKAKDASGRILKTLVESSGGADRLEDVAKAIIDLHRDPSKLNRFTRDAIKPRLRDKLVEVWYNSLLSGPQTHAVNILSNTITAAGQLPEHMLAAGLGALRPGSADRVVTSELAARTIGLMQGVREGLAQAGRTFRTGEGSDFGGKVEAATDGAISGRKGEIIRLPTRALAAEDELFKAMARRMELSGLAARQVRSEGLKGPAGRQRLADLTANPTDEMLEKAFDYGRYLTFQRPLGPVGQSISRMTQDMPVLKLVLPFVRTPTNILKFGLERSPAAPLLTEWRADFKAGGARRDLAVAKVMVGTGLATLITQWAEDGTITGGGPADESAKRLLRADGWQPYSLKVAGRYYSYQRLDPLATTIGVTADMVDLQSHMTDKQKDNTAALVVASMLQNLTNKTWLSGISDMTAAINDPGRYSSNFLARMAGSLAVPAGVAQVARTMDPIMREAKGPLDRIRSRLPGVSRSLTPKRDIWGETITSEGGIGPDILSPIWTTTRKNDPTNVALIGSGASIRPPQKKIGGVELSTEEYGRYQELTGKLAKLRLDVLVRSPGWKALLPDDREDAVEKVLRQARKDAREAMGPLGRAGNSAASLPPGFVMDAPSAGDEAGAPPPGFVIEALPPGFVIER